MVSQKSEIGDTPNGFTLMELLVVLAIIAMGFGVMVVSFGDRSDEISLSRIAHSIRAELYSARLEAIQSGQAITFDLNLETCVFTSLAKAGEFDCPEDLVLRQVNEGSEPSLSVWHVTYFEDGTSAAPELDLVLGENVIRLKFNWITGLIQLETNAS